jgi:hypothetical protein
VEGEFCDVWHTEENVQGSSIEPVRAAVRISVVCVSSAEVVGRLKRVITKFRASILMALSAVAFLIAIPLAQATTDVGSQNPQLTVSASAASIGTAEPDNRATIGDTVKVDGSVTNNTAKKQSALVTVTVRDPQGSAIYSDAENVSLRPGQTRASAYSYVVDESYQKGNYEVTVSASNAKGISSATANLEIY